MQQCRLPIEICEQIIDECAYDRYGDRGKVRELAALRVCALTCKAWLPRGLTRLYHTMLLYGDDRTRNAVQWLRERTGRLAIHVRVLRNLTSYIGSDQRDLSPPFYLVPRLLAPLKQTILGIDTVEIGFFESYSRIQSMDTLLGASTHDIFLRSYTCFRSIHTLELYGTNFDTFSYFARLVLCFRALRHLDLCYLQFKKLNNYPPQIAKLKHLSLHTFTVYELDDLCLIHLVDWFRQADALSHLESLSITANSRKYTEADVPGTVVSAGVSLKHIEFRFLDCARFDCRPSSSLQTIKLWSLAANTALRVPEVVKFNNNFTERSVGTHQHGC